MNTTYLILARTVAEDGDIHSWSERQYLEASNSADAIKKHLKGSEGATALEFVAIPARSWKPVKVKIETKTSVQILAGESEQS